MAAYFCWFCGNELQFEVKVGVKVHRLDTCPHCGHDLHVCKNCYLYDENLHNKCREPESQFIRDREGSNFCTHFSFVERDAPLQHTDLAAAKAKLENLFKNLK